jgi:hypothetical protein
MAPQRVMAVGAGRNGDQAIKSGNGEPESAAP